MAKRVKLPGTAPITNPAISGSTLLEVFSYSHSPG